MMQIKQNETEYPFWLFYTAVMGYGGLLPSTTLVWAGKGTVHPICIN